MPSSAGKEAAQTNLRLFCFPFAGGGTAVYRSWHAKLPSEIDVVPVCLPGREQRFGEPALDNIEDMIAALVDAIRPMTTAPYAFFGHSMGGIIAHHLACRITAEGGRSPEHLFVSALRSPTAATPRRPLHLLPSDEFWAEVADYGGTPAEILESDEYRALFEPLVRADFKLAQTASSGNLPQLACQITAFGGSEDTTPTPEELDGWRQATTGPFEKHIYPGGHFFMEQHEDALLDLIATRLADIPSLDSPGSYSRTSSN